MKWKFEQLPYLSSVFLLLSRAKEYWNPEQPPASTLSLSIFPSDDACFALNSFNLCKFDTKKKTFYLFSFQNIFFYNENEKEYLNHSLIQDILSSFSILHINLNHFSWDVGGEISYIFLGRISFYLYLSQ